MQEALAKACGPAEVDLSSSALCHQGQDTKGRASTGLGQGRAEQVMQRKQKSAQDWLTCIVIIVLRREQPTPSDVESIHLRQRLPRPAVALQHS